MITLAFYDDEDYKKSFDIKITAKILPFMKPYKKIIAQVVALMLIAAVFDNMFPLFQRYAVNNFIANGTTENILYYIMLYIFVISVQTTIVIVFVKKSISMEMYIGRDMKKACFTQLQKLSLSYYNTTPVGYMMARVMSDTNRIGMIVAWGLVDGFWSAAYTIGAFIAMFLLNWRLALVVLVVVPFIALLTAYFQKKILENHRKARRENSRITGAYNEGITGARTSKTLVIEESNSEHFNKITQNMRNASFKTALYNAVYIPTIAFFGSLVAAFVLARGGISVIGGTLDLGTFSAFITYALGIFEPIQMLAKVLTDVVSAQANIERVTMLLEREPGITDTPEVVEKYGDVFTPKTENWETIKGDIEFRDVSFKYPDGDEFVLRNFNLKIPTGTTVAIAGETGAGKSTLVNLACRFFEPTEGQILIDGVDYRERSQLWLHSNIGYVLQTPHLFSGTIRENIRYGNLNATDEDIERVAKQVSADTVVNRLDGGYESDVGESGDKLSTGERQLVSFARAVLADPRIFVLDEATSSVDTHTEKLIQNAIAYILKDRTSFLIAHRLSTIRHADIILVVKDGKIIEQGSHAELLAKKGYYFNLCAKQFEEEATNSVLQPTVAPSFQLSVD